VRTTVDVAQAAALLGCSTAHVYHLCERGTLPSCRDDRNFVRIDCKSLGCFLRNGEGFA
jgi:excisionase family DNA binding protein